MGKLLVLVAILLGAAAMGVALLWNDYQSIPAAAGSPSNPVQAIAQRVPKDRTAHWKQDIAGARRMLLLGAESLQGGQPNDDMVLQQGLLGSLKAEADSEGFFEKLEDVNVAQLVEILSSLHAKGQLLDALTAPNTQDFLRNSETPEVKGAVGTFFAGVEDPYSEFLLRYAVVTVVAESAPHDFDAGKYDDCVSLCQQALKRLESMSLPEVSDQITQLHYRAQEQLDWIAARDATPPGDAVKVLSAYLSKYSSAPYDSYAAHATDATILRSWNGMLVALPERVVEVALAPDMELAVGSFKDIDIAPVIRALHAFCEENKQYRTSHPQAEEFCLRCRLVASRALRQKFLDDTVLQPKDPLDLKTVTVRRTGTEFVGTVSNATEDFVEMWRPTDGENRENLLFFSSALVKPPQYIDESEREYTTRHKTVYELLGEFDWQEQHFSRFGAECERLRFGERAKVVALLAELTKGAVEFRP